MRLSSIFYSVLELILLIVICYIIVVFLVVMHASITTIFYIILFFTLRFKHIMLKNTVNGGHESHHP